MAKKAIKWLRINGQRAVVVMQPPWHRANSLRMRRARRASHGIFLGTVSVARQNPMKPLNEVHLATYRRHMVEVIDIHFDLLSEEIGKLRMEERLSSALLNVPRHLFVPAEFAAVAYHDGPLPIGFDKTISQPFIVALMV